MGHRQMDSLIRLPHHVAALGGRSALGDFPQALRVGQTVYIGAQSPLPIGSGAVATDIETQTHTALHGLVDTLGSAGLGMQDLIKLHTYYVFEGEGSEVTRYWERMTDVRLKYLANPGPAATALRVSGAPTHSRLITVDGIASSSLHKRRLMPAHAWDWSIPTPFSQGWRVDDRVFVGGQISADRKGRALGAGDVLAQTSNTLEYIRHVLLEGGATWDDLVTLKIGYRHDGRDLVARDLLDRILDLVRKTLADPGPALTCFGVDLLYEGLVLEIDAIAVIGATKRALAPQAAKNWASIPGFAPGLRAGPELYVGAVSAPGAASVVAQAEATMERLVGVLEAGGAERGDLVKLNVFFVSSEQFESRDSEAVARIIGDYLPDRRPVVTIVRVPGLPHPGQQVQIDGIAVATGR